MCAFIDFNHLLRALLQWQTSLCISVTQRVSILYNMQCDAGQ